jgi:23S rRNA (uracil1939-C5)-methyltransferase
MSAHRLRRIDVAITGLSEDGLGTGIAAERLLRVRDALPGERVTALVRHRHAGVWYAEAEAHLETALQRTAAPCPAYPRCAGCSLQHLEYGAQVAHKSAVLAGLLAEAGVTAGRLREPVAGPRFHYRHKARLGARMVGGTLLLGFREGFSNRIARTTGCATLAPPLAAALPELARVLSELDVADRIPQVELAAGETGAAFIVRHLAPLSHADELALARFAALPGRRVYLQPGGYHTVHVLGSHPAIDTGDTLASVPAQDYLSYGLPEFGLAFDHLPTDFIQVNPAINRALVRAAVLGLDPQPGDTTVDLFCGIGNFALALARRGALVSGFESAGSAVARATHNAARNGLAHRAEFAERDLYHPSGAALPASRLMVIDPPRSGAGPNLSAWIASGALERLAYVSCNPRTFASDAAVLCAHGFRLAEAGIFDMFPHTAHTETLGIFVRGR